MGLTEPTRVAIDLEYPVRSLCWDGDTLVDWVGGGRRFSLDGQVQRAKVGFSYRFDRAILSPDSKLTVLYEALGTKGLIIRGSEWVREINRSFYRANTYEYPIAFCRLPNGTIALAHCPDEYNKIEIEEAESGKRLTNRTSEPIDFFHSRLQVSPNGKYMISAGWVWQGIDLVDIFHIPGVLQNPELLDRTWQWEVPSELEEINTAAFQSDDVLLMTGYSEDDRQKSLLVGYELDKRKASFITTLETTPGTIMPMGSEHVVGFYDHPKLFEIKSGKIIKEWPDLQSGQQISSMIHHQVPLPPLALDVAHNRFALADERRITVINLA